MLSRTLHRAAAALLLAAAGASQAATIIRSFTISSNVFQGKLEVQYDDSANIIDSSSGISVVSFSSTLPGWNGAVSPLFDYDPRDEYFRFDFQGSSTLDTSKDDLMIMFQAASRPSPAIMAVNYTKASAPGAQFNDQSMTIVSAVIPSFTPVPTPTGTVPEPASLVLVLLALGAGTLAGARRR